MPNVPTRNPETIARQADALAMRERGFTWHQIATALGYASHGAAQYAVRAARRRGGATLTHYGRGTAPEGMPTWATRRFGVEIEHNGISLDATARALRGAGFDVVHEGWTHRVCREWKVVPDSSCGNEAVTPIMRGSAGFASLKTAMGALRSAGARVDVRCGMHVHLDMSDLTGPEIARLVALYVSHQDDIDNLLPRSRRGNTYARRVDAGELDTILDSFTRFGIAPARWSQDRRYRTINVMAFPKYGSIEVRQHQGTLNFTKARAWVLLMMALVEVARQGRGAEVMHGPEFVNSVCAIVGGFSATTIARLNARREDASSPSTLPTVAPGGSIDTFGGCDCEDCVAARAGVNA